MSVGGRLIEILPMTLDDGDSVIRLWVVDRQGDETCVYSEPQDVMPELGDDIWWQCGRIYFDRDRQHLKKVGYSFSAPGFRQRLKDEEAEELFQSERISAALATYDFVLGDLDPGDPDREERAFDAMKAAIQRADYIARTGQTEER